jgi:cyclophilin family peptidyl-prolyl cis-trans isomerase
MVPRVWFGVLIVLFFFFETAPRTRPLEQSGTPGSFYELVTSGYYNDAPLFRLRPKVFVQFGINGTPAIAQSWRGRTIPDDPFQPAHSNVRGMVFFAFAVPNGRTTQVVINLRDNSSDYEGNRSCRLAA